MKNIYRTPKSELKIQLEESPGRKSWVVFFVALVSCYIGVTYLSPFVNGIYVHLIVDRSSSSYWDIRLVSDLIQTAIYLSIGGFFLGRSFSKKWWLVCGLFSAIFLGVLFKIIGFMHVISGDCDRHWYDIMAILITPIAIYFGGVVGHGYNKRKANPILLDE